LQGRMRR